MKVLLKKEVCGSCDSARDPLEKLKCAFQKKKKKKRERERKEKKIQMQKRSLSAVSKHYLSIVFLLKFLLIITTYIAISFNLSFNYH